MRLLLDPVVTEPVAAPPVATAPVVTPITQAAPAAVVTPAAIVPAPTVVPAAAPATKTDSTSATATAPWSKPAEKAVAQATPAATPATVPAKTEEFNLKAPEGVTLEPAVLEGYKTLSKDLGLTSEQAQKLYDRDFAAQQTAQKEAVLGLQKQDAVWAGELQTKWGPNYKERSIMVSRAYDYADPTGEFREKLSRAGLINSPDLTEFVEKFGELFKEDRIPSGATGIPKPKDNRPQQERLAEAFKLEAEKLKKKGQH